MNSEQPTDKRRRRKSPTNFTTLSGLEQIEFAPEFTIWSKPAGSEATANVEILGQDGSLAGPELEGDVHWQTKW